MFWRLVAVGGLLVALGTAGAVLTEPSEPAGVDQPRLQLAVTDAKELRCTDDVSHWEIRADVRARDMGEDTLDAAQLAVAFVRTPGGPTEEAPVRMVNADGFGPGVTSEAKSVMFKPVVRAEVPCGTDTAQLVARVTVAGESLTAADDFLSRGVAMASSIVFGLVVCALVALGVVVIRR